MNTVINNQKHVPVLLKEVLEEFESEIATKESIVAVDCTLGQGGHSEKIFEILQKGTLISLDLDRDEIEWVLEYLKDTFIIKNEELIITSSAHDCYLLEPRITPHEMQTKRWFIVRSDFSKITQILRALGVQHVDFLLADLGFSNYQLDQNRGISFDRPGQKLDMRYEGQEPNSKKQETKAGELTAADVLNRFLKPDLETIFTKLGQIEKPNQLIGDIIAARKIQKFERVGDLLRILNKPRYPKSFKYKVFQALRSFTNKETLRLTSLVSKVNELLNTEAKALIITFNPVEEKIVQNHLQPVQIVEPNIEEIIRNTQSRSAKLYIYKKQRMEST